MGTTNWEDRRRQMIEEDEEDDERRQTTTQVVLAGASWWAQENLLQQPQWGGSIVGRAYKDRRRELANERLLANYFVQNPVFTDEEFRRRFRMRRHVFLQMMHDVEMANPNFRQRCDRAGKASFSPHQRLTCALRMLAYGSPADSLDESFRMPESTAIKNLGEFCHTIVSIYKEKYLCAPTAMDLDRLLQRAERRGFPGMIGSLDYMHWTWKNCPMGWQGSFSGRSKKPTIVLEAVASFDTWIWHAFFGIPGAQNDITVLSRSPLFDALTSGGSPHLDYQINGNTHNIAYYLADGIYPKWATLIQAIRRLENEAEEFYTTKQESYSKDVERAFGVLQARFAIIRTPARSWSLEKLNSIMLTCIILHNMIVEDERDDYYDGESDDEETDPNRSRRARANIYDGPNLPRDSRTRKISMTEYMSRYRMIRSREANKDLQSDLVMHLWSRRGQGF